MKKIILFSALICFSIAIKAQDFQGKAYYFSKTKAPANFGRRGMSETQKKAIMERMKSNLEKTFILQFDKQSSIYNEEEGLSETTNGGRGRWFAMMNGLSSGNYYKNTKEGIYIDQREFYGKNFLIKDTLPKLEWKLVNETKKIGQYTCFKAIATKKEHQLDFGKIRQQLRKSRGQNTEQDIESFRELEEVEVIAWYSPEIPISQGPGAYWGLPGLILEVQEKNTTILCNKIVLNTQLEETIKAPKKGKKVSQEEFDMIAVEKIKEMAEQFNNRSRAGRGRRF
ncbi:GLPGLI family protein [Aquimarina rhabdastrellae]